MRDALRRVELRVLHREAVEEAARTARERFAAGLGRTAAELTKAERRRAAKPVREAVRPPRRRSSPATGSGSCRGGRPGCSPAASAAARPAACCGRWRG
jgi:hypothetical protein